MNLKIVSHVYEYTSIISIEINKELKKLYEKYPNGDLFDIRCSVENDKMSALIIFETEKPEINPLILNQIIESLKN